MPGRPPIGLRPQASSLDVDEREVRDYHIRRTVSQPVEGIELLQEDVRHTGLVRQFPFRCAVQRLTVAQYAAGADTPAMFQVTPEVVSVLDYGKGFGHTDLVRVTDSRSGAGIYEGICW